MGKHAARPHIEWHENSAYEEIAITCQCQIGRDHDYIEWLQQAAGPYTRGRVLATLRNQDAPHTALRSSNSRPRCAVAMTTV